MSIKLWYCKRLTRKIEKLRTKKDKFIKMVNTIQKWIKRDKKRLNKYLNTLSDEENIQFGYDMGFIDESEYQIMLSKNGKD